MARNIVLAGEETEGELEFLYIHNEEEIIARVSLEGERHTDVFGQVIEVY